MDLTRRDLETMTRLRDRAERRYRTPDTPNQFAALARSLDRQARNSSDLGGVWADHAPASIAERTSVVGFARGVLTIGVPNDAVRHDTDRFLREGGLDQIRRASRANVRRIRIVRDPANRGDTSLAVSELAASHRISRRNA